MKNYNFFIISIFTLISFNLSNSQTSRSHGLGPSSHLTIPSFLSDPEPIQIEGSMYLNEEFLPVKILNQIDDIHYLAKYNVLTGDMIFKNISDYPKYKIFKFNKDFEDLKLEFINSGKIFEIYDYEVNGITKRDFFVNLVDNNRVSLLKKHNIKYVKAKPAKTSYDISKPAKFKKSKDLYYIKIGSLNPVLLPTKSKDLILLFPRKYANDISAYIKKNHINLAEETSLIKLFNYIKIL